MVRQVERVTKHPLLNYRGDKTVWFLKLTIQDQRSLPKARDKFQISAYSQRGPDFVLPLRLFESERDPFRFRDFVFGDATYESNIPFTLRFMIDTKVCYVLMLSISIINVRVY